MGKEHILKIIEKMREKGVIADIAFSGTVNVILREDQVEELYQLLNKDNMIIILRSIAAQNSRLGKQLEFKMELFDEIIKEKALENEIVVKLFKAAINKNECEIFVKAIDLLN